MKIVLKAIRLYLKTAVKIPTLIFGLLLMILVMAIFAFESPDALTQDHMSMINILGMGHMGIFIITGFGACKTHLCKFYGSSSCAKHLFITAPIVFTAMICLTYDVIINVLSYMSIGILAYLKLGASSLSDIMIFNSIYSGVFIFCAALIGKPKYGRYAFGAYLGIGALSSWISKNESFQNGFGLPVSISVIISIAAYTIFITITVIIANRWWKTGNRMKEHTQFTQIIMG